MPLARKLGPLDATMIVVSGIIGSGIFINPYLVARAVETPFLIIAVWVLGGVIALCGAFVFAELGTVLPRAGGQYAFFREAFHPLIGFLHGWSLLLIIQSGATAAVAVACGTYIARLAGLPDATVTPMAIALLLGLVVLHASGIKPGAIVINVITIGKTLAIAALVLGAFVVGRRSGLTFEPLAPPQLHGAGLVSAVFAGLVPAMFVYGGWQNANFVVEEMRDPERNLPRAILLGVAIVIVVYVSANVAYVHVLTAPVLAETQTPAAELARRVLGPWGADALSVLVIVSTFGFLNLALMTAPRVYYAMARDGLFFSAVARVSPRSHVPVTAIATQGVLAAGFALLNAYDRLVGYAVFADWIFFALAGVALLVFRRTRPDAPRPYRAPLYPVLPLVFTIAGFGIVANMFISDPWNALTGSAIIALGVPVFFAWRWAGARGARLETWLRDPAWRRRAGLGLTVFTLVTALLVTLYPFHFQLSVASWRRIDWRLYYPGHSDRDLVLNLIMLAPLGAGLVVMRFARARLWRIVLEACVLGFGLAVFVESLQIFERTRFPQAADVWRNGVGCAVGAVVTAWVLSAMDRKPRG